jgi:hypothetical protein
VLKDYYLDDQIKKDMGGLVSRVGDRRGTYKVLVGKSELKRKHGRPKYRCKNNVKSVGMALDCIYLC